MPRHIATPADLAAGAIVFTTLVDRDDKIRVKQVFVIGDPLCITPGNELGDLFVQTDVGPLELSYEQEEFAADVELYVRGEELWTGDARGVNSLRKESTRTLEDVKRQFDSEFRRQQAAIMADRMARYARFE